MYFCNSENKNLEKDKSEGGKRRKKERIEAGMATSKMPEKREVIYSKRNSTL